MWKRDEMEQNIYDKSARTTWQVTLVTLLILGIYQNRTIGGNNPYILVASASAVLHSFLDRFYFSRVTEKKNFSKFVGLVIFLTFIMIWAIMLMV